MVFHPSETIYIWQTSLATDDATQNSWVEMLPSFAIVTSILMISSVGYRHSGKYTCIAKNSAGISFESTELKVNGL